jgi:capsular exopolysaccharide synthesis family protein
VPLARPPALSAAPDLPALLRALQRRWLLALGLSLVLVPAAAVGAWYAVPARYTAFAQLHIAAAPDKLLGRPGDGGRGDFALFQKTQAKHLTSRAVLLTALADDKVKNLPLVRSQGEPLTWLEEELRVESSEGNEIMTVLLSGTSPDEQVAVLDAVTRAYEERVVRFERDQKTKKVKELDDLYNKKDAALRKDREEFSTLAKKLDASDAQVLFQKQMGLVYDLMEWKRLHAKKRDELLDARRRLDGAKAQAQVRTKPALPPLAGEKEKLPAELPTLNEALDQDKTFQDRQARVSQLRDRVATFETQFVQKDEPTLVRARRQLAEEERLLEERRAAIQTELVRLGKRLKEREKKPAGPGLASLPQSEADPLLAQLQAEVTTLEAQEKELAQRVTDSEAAAKKISTSSVDLENLRTKIQREQKMAEEVWSQAESVRAELGSQPRVTIHQAAALQKKDIKRQVMAAGVSPLMALAAICLAVAWLEFRTRRIRNADEVATGLGIRVVGSVPPLTRQGAPEGALESIDAIRTLLLREAGDDAMRVVMVTSANAGEGKTTLASSLADSLARAGRKTLFVDCDLRTPAAHQLFELPLQPGFSEVLLGEIDAVDAIQATPVAGLWLMAAGQWDREVIQALAREGIREIFEKLKEEYDFIVVDSHPVLAATDSLLLGQHVDAVLLSVLRDVSRSPRVYQASQRLATLGIRMLGAVVNGAEPDEIYAAGYAPPLAAGR